MNVAKLGRWLAKLRKETAGRILVYGCAALVILITLAIVVFVARQGLTTFVVDKISVFKFLFSSEWNPELPASQGGPLLGSLTMSIGSLLTSGLAVLLAAPTAIIAAVFLVEIAPSWGRQVLQPAIELLAGIPSVVYGYTGLVVLVPLVRERFGGMGFSLLAGGIVLGIMILPTIASLSADSLRALPSSLKEAAYALGSTRWQTIRLVLLPAAKPGILTGIILGLARAFGEALAVQMVIGNVRHIPHSILDPVITLTSAITLDMGYTVSGSTWNNALWSMSLMLLVMTCIFILLARMAAKGREVR
ncbi:MAG: phosphate ABC transporter permease subunit PstC [Clostridia bacterium]|nr:phosphate ABC transporter permease subunit PstC [Clostridia bacterium]